MMTTELAEINRMIDEGGTKPEDGGNEWLAYERFKRKLRVRFHWMKDPCDYDAAIKKYAQRWLL
jgi:hypothetical protein